MKGMAILIQMYYILTELQLRQS